MVMRYYRQQLSMFIMLTRRVQVYFQWPFVLRLRHTAGRVGPGRLFRRRKLQNSKVTRQFVHGTTFPAKQRWSTSPVSLVMQGY